MKNPHKKSLPTKKPPEGKGDKSKETPIQEEQYLRMTTIASDIIEAVQSELNSGDSQSLLKNFLEIIKTLQSGLVSQFERNKCRPQIEEAFNKNFDVITNYFIKCLQVFDNVKVNSIENLKTCLTQLFQIVFNELNRKDKAMADQEQAAAANQSLITQEEKFVYLINSLSTSIKAFMKNSKSIMKDLMTHSDELNEHIVQCKMSLNDLMIQASLPSIGKSSLKVLKDRINALIEKADIHSQLNGDIQKGMKQIDAYGVKFYDEAKDIFRKLKVLHNQKMADFKKEANDYPYPSSTQANVTYPNSNKPINYLMCQKQQSQSNNRRNQSVSPTRKRILSSNATNSNTRNNNNFISESNQSNSNANTLLREAAKSTEHYKAKTIAGKKRDSSNSKQLNISTSTGTNANNVTHFDTSPNFYSNSIQGNNQLLTELSDKNKALITQIGKLNEENRKLRNSVSSIKKNSESIFIKSIPKSKSLRNFLSSNASNCQADANVNAQGEESPILIDGITRQLAESILSFLNSLKELQTSICKKAENVSELKKDFEKQKKDLHQFAFLIQAKGLSSNSEAQGKDKEAQTAYDNANKQLTEEVSQLRKSCKEEEAVIHNLTEEMNMKNNEIAKIALELQKCTESKKGLLSQSKLKELDNKIQSLKAENEQLKTFNASYEAKTAELTADLLNKPQHPQAESPSKQSQLLKENEELKAVLAKLKKANEELTESIAKQISSFEEKTKLSLIDKEERELKYNTLLNELSARSQEISTLTQMKADLEKERKDISVKLTSLQSELKDAKKANEGLKEDNDKQLQSISQYEKQSNEYKGLIDKMMADSSAAQDELNKQKDREQTALMDIKAKLAKKDSELNEMRKILMKREKENSSKAKEDPGTQISKESPSFKKEFIEVSQLLHQVSKAVNDKYKELRSALSSHEMRKNLNDAMLIDEEDEDNYDQTSEKNATSSSIKRVDQLMNRNKSDYNEINQTILLVFKLIEKHLKQSQSAAEEKPTIKKEDRKDKDKGNTRKDNRIIKDFDLSDDRKTIEDLQTEISNLKSFFTECTNTIFDAIKVAAPHMIDEESELSLNIVSGGNTPVNLLDSKDSPIHSGKNAMNATPITNPVANQQAQTFDPEFISAAVAKFKLYNNDINEQLKKLEMEKSELEREVHSNIVKAQAYKTALDDAIMKINANSEDIQLNKYASGFNNNNNSGNSGNLPRDNARTFTVEDIENPQSDHNKPRNESSPLTTSKLDYKKINADLMLIQSDLLKKLERKEEECNKLQESLNSLLKPKEGKDADLQMSTSKYKQMLLLYASEQEKNNELRASYYSLMSEFTAFVNQKETKKQLNTPLSNPKNEITLGEAEEDEKGDHDSSNRLSQEEESVPKKNQQKGERKDHPGRNFTHSDIKYTHHKDNYLELLNDKELQSNHSASNQNDFNIQELLNENKNLEEQEKLLMTQLLAVKKELKETREQVRKLLEENSKLKKTSGPGDREDILEPLKNALEKLIYEITFTPKIKEFMNVILRVVGYSDEKILEIYQAKDKKKGFFKMFKS